ncbi:hypothetical protein U1737_13575 [Sphingomonas sp. LB3N6]|uniref:hypothetical protein n=1 Tax=Sphingomonas fucosidasi TaxID=3096164 RepID=UPI002FC912E3
MPDRRDLKNIANTLREQAQKLQAFNLPSDHDIPQGMRLLLDAIDRVDVAVLSNFDVRPRA